MVTGVSAILLLDRRNYLSGYRNLILGEHRWALTAPLTVLAIVFAAIHSAANKVGL